MTERIGPGGHGLSRLGGDASLSFPKVFVVGAAFFLVPACTKREPPPLNPSAAVVTAPSAPPTGSGVKEPSSPAPDLLQSAPSLAAQAPDGAAIFTQVCATCHMADGNGVPYLQPSIRSSPWISHTDPQPLLSLILRGSSTLGDASQAYENDMAPQEHLSDGEIAAVASYVRRRFAASAITEPVTPAQVALARSRPGLP